MGCWSEFPLKAMLYSGTHMLSGMTALSGEEPGVSIMVTSMRQRVEWIWSGLCLLRP